MKVIERTAAGTDNPQLAKAATDVSATLVMVDGTTFRGKGLGTPGTVVGELVFTTAMTGYEEALTDPSFRGLMLLFTYPLIGNYGVEPGRAESGEIQPRAAIVGSLTDTWDGPGSLRSLLLSAGIPTLHDVDTRAVVQWVRHRGALPAALALHAPGIEPDLAAMKRACEGYDYDQDSLDFVARTTVPRPETHGKGRTFVALLDCGNKRSVIEELVQRDTHVAVLPAHTTAKEILALAPDGLVLSNGPGNPANCTKIIETVRGLYGKMPMFGICLGHQVLALAAGGSTFKLRFGHRGANHPVQDLTSGQVLITTQNHGFSVDEASLPPDLLVSHRNLNDGTVEGLRHRTLPISSVQFHPEGAPGPRDAGTLLDEWLESLA